MMSTCRWCMSVGPDALDLLQKYCTGSLSAEDERAANDDLYYCLECVVEYHRARDSLPSMHKRRLWELETSRLLARFTQASEEELDEDDLVLIEDDQEIQIPKFTAAEYENLLRVSLTEILKYPYLLWHSTLCAMCVEALCKMENSNSFQVFEKYPGIYLLLVHPNETVRRWAIRAARSLGKVDRDDFYDLKDVFSSIFNIIQLDIFQECDIDTSYDPEGKKMVLLPRHLYDSTNYKNYWLGICMLLTVLNAQAMDSLLLGPDKQTDIIQCILNTMEKAEEVPDESRDPFWPSLQCFMVILDRLGSKVWGQQIEPVSAFQAITGSSSYKAEIEKIRRKTTVSKIKAERECDDSDEDMVTCSQIVYESNIKDKRKDFSIRGSASEESSNVIYEEMHSLVDVLQSDLGQDMRVHNSTFLWFIPFVESVMDLDELGIVYTMEIIHYLCGGIKDVINRRILTCDKVTELFTRILLFIVGLHLRKRRMNALSYGMADWIEVIVKCATLPCSAFPQGSDSGSNRVSSTSTLKSFYRNPQVSTEVPQACMQVIRSLLKEGGKLTLHSKPVRFLDMLNNQFRVASLKEWNLSDAEVKELQNCLKQIVKLMKGKSHSQATDRSSDALTPPPANNNPVLSFGENCRQPLQSEKRLISEQCTSKVIESRDCINLTMGASHVFTIKKEPNVAGENSESVSKFKPCLQLTKVAPDPGKRQELKSEPSPSHFTELQDIEISSDEERYTVETFTKGGPPRSVSRCQEGPESAMPSTSVSERRDTGTQMTQRVSEGCDYGDDMPLSAVKGLLRKSQKSNRGLNQPSTAACGEGHNGPLDSRTEEQKGKKKEKTVRGNRSQLQTVVPASDVIVISDSESGKEDETCVGTKKIDGFGSTKFKLKSEPLGGADLQKSPIHDDLSENDSQLFEFETPQEVFSAWPAQETKQDFPSLVEPLKRPGSSDPNNTSGYEKKVIKPVEQTSGVEKLNPKKTKRNMSQMSLDCADHLKTHGQGDQVEQDKSTISNKKSRLISPQKLIVKGNKNLLASQDRQFLRQCTTKPPSLQSVAASEQAIAKQLPDQIRKTNSKRNDIPKPSVTEEDQDRDDSVILPSLLPVSVVDYRRRERQADQRLQESRSTFDISSSESKQSSETTTALHSDSLSGKHNHGIVNDTKRPSANELFGDSDLEDSEEDADMMDLTQMDPVDMEMCSQIEEDDDGVFLTQRDPVDMDIECESQISSHKSPRMDLEEGQEKAVTPPMGSVVQKPSTSKQQDDQVFLKPGMSPSSLRKAKPSTTKIYAPSSRSATLVQEMEKTAKLPPPVAKNKCVRPVLPVRKGLPQPVFKQPHPVNRSVPVKIGTIASSPHVPSYKTYARPETPVNKVMPLDSGRKFDPSVLIHNILSNWTYEMFTNCSQFGAPLDLCNLPLKEVGNSFSSYEEYFGTFYPLLLMNTFEEIASSWEKNRNVNQIITHDLKVIGIEPHNQMANATFTASVTEREIQHQLHAKEDDLVLLSVPQNRSMYGCNEPEPMEAHTCFGCVSRSSLSDERSTLNLSIQTPVNVSAGNNRPVKCQVMGSLGSAVRLFRALYVLKNHPMVRPVLAPQVDFFQPSPENVSLKNLTKYNPEQVKAIKWGVSIVKRQERSPKPKICLIHGPPGTGKSETIVGLLLNIFSEGHSAATVSQFSKACRLRVLLCAPSNAAVDNLMKKVILAFKGNCRNQPLGNCGDINLVRLGLERTISKDLKPFSLDSQTWNKTQKALQGLGGVDLGRRIRELDQNIDDLSRKMSMVKDKNSDEHRMLSQKKCNLFQDREKLWRQQKETRGRKQEVQSRVLQDAHIICCTLSTSGSSVLESAFRRLGHEPFRCVIVDEAGQATEPETLIPMQFRCPSLILVGDPEQLPPTVVSQTAKEKKYDQSLMARLWNRLHRIAENHRIAVPVVLLTTQYRMHPDICRFPSLHIYNSALTTDNDTAQSRCASTWPFQPYRLFDVTDGYENKDGESFCNHKEVKLVLILIKMILEKKTIKVGVITPYNAQKSRIQEAVRRELTNDDGKQVEVDTVDGFQGKEKDCIIVSCVRANGESGSIGFLRSRQRMNVTITRAKYSFFICGHMKTLKEERDWGALIQDASRRGTIIKTREKDFNLHAKQIFKPDSGFTRSLSYPPKAPGFPSPNSGAPAFQGSEKHSAGSSSAASAGRAAPFRAHQRTDPPPVGVASKGRSSAQLPTSRVTSSERPRDPRLAVQPPPHHVPDSSYQRERPHKSVSWQDGPAPPHASRDYTSHHAPGLHKWPSNGRTVRR